MRSKNDGALIGATLRALYQQDFPAGLEVIHIDSGSTDETVDVIRASHPAKLIQIRPEEYVPGVVLNRGMRESRSDWVVFLNSDAEPANRNWLSELIAAARSEPRIGTAFSRQTPRPDSRAIYAHDHERCFGPQRESRRWDHFFSMVSCVVNRQAWEEHPFREDLQYAEDDEWSRRLHTHGWKTVFAENSVAVHSHNYTFRESYKRAYGDTFASAATSEVSLRDFSWPRTVGAGVLRDAARDLNYCFRQRRLEEWPHAVAVRVAQRMGKLHGYRAGWTHYRRGQQ